MKRATPRPWVVDWHGEDPPAPAVGHLVARMTATQQHSGIFRVIHVRLMRHTKPLRPGVKARYRVTAVFYASADAYRGEVNWVCNVHPRAPPRRPVSPDRFSPLL